MATAPNIDESLVKSILAEVQTELDSMMKSEMLAKARPGESTPGEGEEDSSKTDPSGDNTSAAASSPDAASASPDASSDDGSASAPPPDASASPPADDGSAPPDASAPAPGGDPAADQGPIDPAQLVAEYSKLSLEDKKLHYQALKEAIIQDMASAGGDASASAAPPMDASASASAPPAAPPGPPAPDASAPALKAEKGMAGQKPGESATKAPDGMKEHPEANGENPLHKAEAEVAALRKELTETHQAVAGMAKALQHVMETPMRKSVQFAADLPAPAVDVSKMSPEQVRSKLADKVKEGTLSKSDKDLVIKFEMNKVKADQVAHLLK